MKLHSVKRGEPADGRPTLVLLHGFGADELDLLPIADQLGRPLAVVSLQGPYSLGGGMRAWFHLQQTREGFLIDQDEVVSADALVDDALGELHRERGKLFLFGFSQGACMAARAALAAPQRVRGLVSLSGVPPLVAPLERAPAEAVRGLPAFAAHGQFDPLLPLPAGHALRDALQDAGLDVTWREYPMGHMVVPDEIADLREWLAKR